MQLFDWIRPRERVKKERRRSGLYLIKLLLTIGIIILAVRNIQTQKQILLIHCTKWKYVPLFNITNPFYKTKLLRCWTEVPKCDIDYFGTPLGAKSADFGRFWAPMIALKKVDQRFQNVCDISDYFGTPLGAKSADFGRFWAPMIELKKVDQRFQNVCNVDYLND